MASVCLCMIVKDESAVIERCLASVRDIVDHWVICDTGSTDGTQQRIVDAMGDLPGELHQHEWVDFGHNRSELMRLARGRADYLLLLDADWTLEAERSAFEGLSADAYMVRHRHEPQDDMELYNRHLVRGDRLWRYVGTAHEYIETDGPVRVERLEGATIVNWADGGVGRERRWQRDVELLDEELMRDPGNLRAVFYLAQTHRDLGNTRRALELYERRALLGGWEEEVFYSLYQVGALTETLGDWPAAAHAYLRAWSMRPSRLEPLYRLSMGLRERELHEPACLFAKRGVDQAQPEDVLFVEPGVYRWGMLFEYSISAYWTGRHKSALTACDRLLAMDDLPEPIRAQTAENREFCAAAVRKSAAPRAVVTGIRPRRPGR